MQAIRLVLVVGVALGASAARADQAASPAVLLEKGVYAEETLGDLPAAIAIYRQIVDGVEANRPTVAQALYRLGMCHLKAGQEDAAKEAFEQLVTRYPERRELVAQAREHMPGPPFPKIVGCRLIETVALTAGRPAPGWQRAAAGTGALSVATGGGELRMVGTVVSSC